MKKTYEKPSIEMIDLTLRDNIMGEGIGDDTGLDVSGSVEDLPI